MKLVSPKWWFTLAELTIVLWIIIVFSVIAYNIWSGDVLWKKSLDKSTYQQIHTLYNTMRFEAENWYAIKATVNKMKDRKDLLPEDYVLYIQSNGGYSQESTKYYKIYTQTRNYMGVDYTRLIDIQTVPFVSNIHYLKEIILKRNENDPGDKVNSVAISFKNPTAIESFYIDNPKFLQKWNVVNTDGSSYTINEFSTPAEDNVYTVIDLVYYTNDKKKALVYRMHKDNQWYVLNN